MKIEWTTKGEMESEAERNESLTFYCGVYDLVTWFESHSTENKTVHFRSTVLFWIKFLYQWKFSEPMRMLMMMTARVIIERRIQLIEWFVYSALRTMKESGKKIEEKNAKNHRISQWGVTNKDKKNRDAKNCWTYAE